MSSDYCTIVKILNYIFNFKSNKDIFYSNVKKKQSYIDTDRYCIYYVTECANSKHAILYVQYSVGTFGFQSIKYNCRKML